MPVAASLPRHAPPRCTTGHQGRGEARPAVHTYARQLGGAVLDLVLSNEVPDAGDPVSQESKDGHEEGEHHRAVLRVAVQVGQQPQQPQEPHCLE